MHPHCAALQPILERTLLKVSAMFAFKAPNKVYLNRDFGPDQPIKRWMYSQQGFDDRVRALEELRGIPAGRMVAEVERRLAASIPMSGCCGELAGMAFHELLKLRGEMDAVVGRPVQVYLVDTPFDKTGSHSFVLVNEPALPCAQASAGAMVLDPWARIVCPAEAFKEAWILKMRKWTNRGMVILSSDEGTSPSRKRLRRQVTTPECWGWSDQRFERTRF